MTLPNLSRPRISLISLLALSACTISSDQLPFKGGQVTVTCPLPLKGCAVGVGVE